MFVDPCVVTQANGYANPKCDARTVEVLIILNFPGVACR